MAAVCVNVTGFAMDSERILKSLQEQEMDFEELSNIVDFVETVWESERQREFTSEFQSQKMEVERALQSLREDVVTMQKYVRDWMAYDEWLSGKLKVS